MRFSIATVAALAASVVACPDHETEAGLKLLERIRNRVLPVEKRATMFKLEVGADDVIEVTEDEKFELIDNHVSFFDITNWPDQQVRAVPTYNFPNATKYGDAVRAISGAVSLEKITKQLGCFSAFHNRYFNSRYGVESTNWLYQEVQKVLDTSGQPFASSRLIQHTAWSQPSIIVSIPGKVRLKTIVVGAHLDSVISGDRGAGRAPGADDNGSGSIMLLNVLGALLADPRIKAGDHWNTIEIHWYAAEESGLLGSQDIFNTYARLGIEVEAMLNQDMVAFAGRDGRERFGLITDFTNAQQNEFIKKLVDEYADIPYEENLCGYACSDHASANRNGFPSSFLFEAPFGNHNPLIHTPNDTLANADLEHIMQHVKVVSGFLYELAHHDFAVPA